MQETSVVFTYDDYLTLPNDGKRYEIIEGELFMTPAPFTDHQRISANIYRVLDAYARSRNFGEVFYAPMDVVLSMTNIVQPDLIVISKERLHIITKKNVIEAPDLVVEIISESTEKTDRVTKKALYEQYGVKEYWLVDPEKKVIEVYELRQNKFTLAGAYQSDKMLKSPLLQDFTFKVSEVFEK